MSYVVRVWEKPRDWPMPSGFAEAQAQLDRLDALPEAPSAKMALLGERLHKIFPQAARATENLTWEEPANTRSTGPVWNIGIVTRDQLDDAQAVLVTQATAMGLNVLDEQAGELHLGDGSMHAVPGFEARLACVRAFAARAMGDLPAARAEFRRLTLQGNVHAQLHWANMFTTGRGERRDLAIGCALVCAAQGWKVDADGTAVPPASAQARASGEAIRRAVGPQAVIHADRMLRRSGTTEALVRRIDDFREFSKEVEPQIRRAIGAASAGQPEASRPRRAAPPADPAPERVAFGAGQWALVAALLAVLPVFTFPHSARLLFVLWFTSAALGAYGAWMTGTALEWSLARRVVFVAGMVFLPTTVFFVIAALWAALQARPR